MKELYITRDDRQAIGKRSPLVTPLGGKVFWETFRDNLNSALSPIFLQAIMDQFATNRRFLFCLLLKLVLSQ